MRSDFSFNIIEAKDVTSFSNASLSYLNAVADPHRTAVARAAVAAHQTGRNGDEPRYEAAVALLYPLAVGWYSRWWCHGRLSKEDRAWNRQEGVVVSRVSRLWVQIFNLTPPYPV